MKFFIFLFMAASSFAGPKECAIWVNACQEDIEAAREPDLPIRSTSYEAYANTTKVLRMVSFADKEIRVKITWIVDGNVKESFLNFSAFHFDRASHEIKVGHREGFPFKAGDIVVLSSPGFHDLSYEIL